MDPVLIVVVAVAVLLSRPQQRPDPIVITIAREEPTAASGGCIAPLLAAIAFLLLALMLGV